MEKDIFWEKYNIVADDVQTVRLAATDTYNMLNATDNYVEKYLPFVVQGLISENVISTLPRPLQNDKRKLSELSVEEKFQLTRY